VFPIKVPPLAEVCVNRRKLLWKWNTVHISSTQGKSCSIYKEFFLPHLIFVDKWHCHAKYLAFSTFCFLL
jgi:hypothetical protein